jgi:predicted transcriptional regulator
MVLDRKPLQRLAGMANSDAELAVILEHADTICHSCHPVSPMICIEQCDVWKTKKDFIDMNGMLCTDDHVHHLFNALKNERRRKVMQALSNHPHSIERLQGFLKSEEYYHSQQTITHQYVEPLVEAGLLRKDGAKYRLTLYGRKFLSIIAKFDGENPLPPRSLCYEETLLRELRNGPKSYTDLVESVPLKSLSRPLHRLLESGLVKKSNSSSYVFYFKTKKMPQKAFSPTERRVYEAIPDEGISAHGLSERATITLRRTYKYLQRLRKRRLVFTRKKPRTYEVTASGRKLADSLEEMVKLVSDAWKTSAFLLERSRQPPDAVARSLVEAAPRPDQPSAS